MGLSPNATALLQEELRIWFLLWYRGRLRATDSMKFVLEDFAADVETVRPGLGYGEYITPEALQGWVTPDEYRRYLIGL